MGIASPAIEVEEDKPQDRFEVDLVIQGHPKRLSVNVSRNDLNLSIDQIMLDFWDVDKSTDNPFMHMFTSADRAVDFVVPWDRLLGLAQSGELGNVGQGPGLFLGTHRKL